MKKSEWCYCMAEVYNGLLIINIFYTFISEI